MKTPVDYKSRDFRGLLVKYFRSDFPQERMGIADKYLLGLIVNKEAARFIERGNIPLAPAFYTGVLKEMKEFGYSPDLNRRIAQDSSRWLRIKN